MTGIFFRVKREGVYVSVELEYLTQEELRQLLDDDFERESLLRLVMHLQLIARRHAETVEAIMHLAGFQKSKDEEEPDCIRTMLLRGMETRRIDGMMKCLDDIEKALVEAAGMAYENEDICKRKT